MPLLLSDFLHSYDDLPVTGCHNPMKILHIKPQKHQDKKQIIIVIQEIFGINESLKQTCMHYADLGYTVLCPDLFHRLQAGIHLTDSNPQDLNQAFDYFNQFNVTTGITDIQAVIDYAYNTLGADSVGVVGYCLGGLLAYLTACRTKIDACVAYYGVHIQNHLAESDNIQTPVMLHIAQNDEFVPSDAQNILLNHFDNSRYVTCEYYQNAQHAFARVDGIHYNAEMALIANQKTEMFFKKNL